MSLSECTVSALEVGIPLVLLSFVGQIAIHIIYDYCKAYLKHSVVLAVPTEKIQEHLLSEKKDKEDEEDEDETSSSFSSSESEEDSLSEQLRKRNDNIALTASLPPPLSPLSSALPPSPLSPVEIPLSSPVETSLLSSFPLTKAFEINKPSSQQQLADRDLQLNALRENFMSIAPLMKQRLVASEGISETEKRGIVGLINSITSPETIKALSSLPSMVPSPIPPPLGSNNILDDIDPQQIRDEESNHLVKVLSELKQ